MTQAFAVLAVMATAMFIARYVGGKRSRKKIALTLVVTILGAALYAGYLGYYGGPIYTDIASARGTKRWPGVAAVILSGDMGFHTGMAPKIAARLAADGVPVVGVNSLTFFRTRRTQRETTVLVEQAARRAMAFGRTDRVILIGQSFGADMLQSGIPLLSPSLRSHVVLVALIVPGETVSYRASPSDLFGMDGDEGDGIATARQLGWTSTICVFGLEETDSLCPHLTSPAVKRIGLPGGHPLHRDVGALYMALRGAIDRVRYSR